MNLDEYVDFSKLKAEGALVMLDGWRLVQILAQKAPVIEPGVPSITGIAPGPIINATGGDSVELTYSFGKNLEFKNLRATAREGQIIPSISDICIGSFLYENEIHELFGVRIEGIVIDYKGTLYQTTKKRAFNPEVGRG